MALPHQSTKQVIETYEVVIEAIVCLSTTLGEQLQLHRRRERVAEYRGSVRWASDAKLLITPECVPLSQTKNYFRGGQVHLK